MASPLGLTSPPKKTQVSSNKFSNNNTSNFRSVGAGNEYKQDYFSQDALSNPQFGDNGYTYTTGVSDGKVQGIKYVSQDDPTNEVQYGEYTGDYNSIFNGTKWYYRPTVSEGFYNFGNYVKTGVTARSSKRHDEDIYDISTNSIIDYSNNEKMPALKLSPSHFVYLKDYGVYPNNRLIVCRRFPAPVENDLTAYSNNQTGPANATLRTMNPLSTIVSWISDSQENFFSFETSEEWSQNSTEDPIKDLSDIFNEVIGKALPTTPGAEMSGGIGAIFKALPIGGIAETLEIAIVNYLLGSEGKPATNFSYDNLHVGNPNFMGQSAYRNINSIKSSISIPIKVVYEMKYINGIDPTIAFMDVVQNILRFSSSQSVFYMSQAGGENINKIIEKFKNGDWVGIIGDILDVVIRAVKDLVKSVSDLYKQGAGFFSKIIDGEITSDDVSKAKNLFISGLSMISRSALARYRIEFNRIMPAMTGFASTPWHLTIGNPKNPFFSSGDMIVDGGKVTFGNILGFNDLPTRIEFEFTIKSARNLGIQEIFDKFNVGAGRQYQRDTIKFEIDWNQGRVNRTVAGALGQQTDEEVREDMIENKEIIEGTDKNGNEVSLNPDDNGNGVKRTDDDIPFDDGSGGTITFGGITFN